MSATDLAGAEKAEGLNVASPPEETRAIPAPTAEKAEMTVEEVRAEAVTEADEDESLARAASGGLTTGTPSVIMAHQKLPETTEVIIIGAGPTGLSLACDLARRGIDLLLFDVNNRPVEQSRAVLLQSRSLEIMANLGIAHSALICGSVVRGLQIMVNGKMTADIPFSYGESKTPFPFPIALEQSKTERLLVDRLTELGSFIVRPAAVWKVEVTEERSNTISYEDVKDTSASVDASTWSAAAAAHAQQAARELGNRGQGGAERAAESAIFTAMSMVSDPGATNAGPLLVSGLPGPAIETEERKYPCTVHLRLLDLYGARLDNADRKVRCRYVIGCDGAKSSLSRALDITYRMKGVPTEYLAADVIVDWSVPLALDRMHVIQTVNGSMICSPLPEGQWRIMCSRDCDANTASTLLSATVDTSETEPYGRLDPPDTEELRHIISTLVPGSVLDSVAWCSAYYVQPRVAETFRHSSAFLAGDAAHVHSPLLSYGLNAGIQDAYNLGWKVASVIRGTNSQILDTYTTERIEAAEDVFGAANQLLNYLVRPSLGVRCMLNIVAPIVSANALLSQSLARWFGQHSFKYSKSALTADNRVGKAEPGGRLSDATIVGVQSGGFGVPYSPEETPQSLLSYLRGEGHTLLLFVHVLPPGTKARTMFGCERREEAQRWNMKSLEHLAKLARLLSELPQSGSMMRSTMLATTKAPRTLEEVDPLTLFTSEQLRVVWVLCGLVNFRSDRNTVAFGQIRDHVPHRLLHYFFFGSRVRAPTYVTVDFENDAHSSYGLGLADPDGLHGDDRSGAFILVRPDGHVCCNGYAGDREAKSCAFDYVLTWLTPERK